MIGTISNYKGGTGKTITAVNLSAALTTFFKKKILVVDMDPQSDSTRALLPFDAPEVDECMYDLLDPNFEDDINIEDYIYPTIHKNLFIIPNITESSGLEIPLSIKFPDSNLYLRRRIYEYAKANFDYTLIDCPPTLSIFVANALYASDFVLIPMLAGSGNSIEGIKGVIELMESVIEDGNSNLRFLKILINKIDRRKTSHKSNILVAEKRYGKEHIFRTSIPTSGDFEVMEALKGCTIFSKRRNSKGAKSFIEIAKEFIGFFEDN